MTHKERSRRILQAIEECDRFINKESPRDPELRPAETQKILDSYINHRAKLVGMLDN